MHHFVCCGSLMVLLHTEGTIASDASWSSRWDPVDHQLDINIDPVGRWSTCMMINVDPTLPLLSHMSSDFTPERSSSGQQFEGCRMF